MDQPIRDGDHRSLGGTTLTLIGCIFVEVIYATTAMFPSENPNTRNRLESIKKVGRKSRNIESLRNEVDVIPNDVNIKNEFSLLCNFEENI